MLSDDINEKEVELSLHKFFVPSGSIKIRGDLSDCTQLYEYLLLK